MEEIFDLNDVHHRITVSEEKSHHIVSYESEICSIDAHGKIQSTVSPYDKRWIEAKDWNMLTKISLSRDNIVGLRKTALLLYIIPWSLIIQIFGMTLKIF